MKEKTGEIKKELKGLLPSDDVEFLSVKVGKSEGVLVFLKELTDKALLGQLVLKPLSEVRKKPSPDEFFNIFFSPEKKRLQSIDEAVKEIVSGNSVLIVEDFSHAVSFGLKNFEKRSITEPPTSTVIKGPREGFVESLPVNISMMRRRLKSPDLIFEYVSVGDYGNTQVALCYISGIADENLVREIRDKIKNVEVDAALDSSYLSKFLGGHKTSLFKQVGNTEKPDILSAKILEGRVAVFVDGSPIVLTVPYLLIEDFQSPSDYYNSSYNATFARLLRLLSVMLALLLPAFFVSAELFHLQFIPLSFLLTIINSIKGIPLSPSFEMFFTLIIFEILNEASVRMPKYVGMVVSIVGGLVLGETAVNAGIISAPTLMIIALSGICLFTVPELEKTFAVLRLIFLIAGGSVGAYGILLSMAVTLVYVVSFENYRTPLFAPFSPLIKSDLKDGFIKSVINEGKSRPRSILKARNEKKLSR